MALLAAAKVPLPHGVCVLLPEQATPGAHSVHAVRVVSVPGKGWEGVGRKRNAVGVERWRNKRESVKENYM